MLAARGGWGGNSLEKMVLATHYLNTASYPNSRSLKTQLHPVTTYTSYGTY
jgi:hypothetical protein